MSHYYIIITFTVKSVENAQKTEQEEGGEDFEERKIDRREWGKQKKRCRRRTTLVRIITVSYAIVKFFSLFILIRRK